MFNITVRDIIAATGGKLLCGDATTVIEDVCIDSRKIKAGDLFIPIAGNNVDAHRFIEGAMEIGAATLTEKHSGVVVSEKPYIQVMDTTKALQDIGSYIRAQRKIPIVGVTGSVGKTTTREMISCALSCSMNTYQTEGNFNSQVGVPICVSRIKEDTEVAVLEMGMSEEGEMKTLSHIVRPSIAVVTNIGVAHIEQLKTKENIRREKLSIVDGMRADGILFLNGDDPMLEAVKGKTGMHTLYYGTSDWCDYRAENIRIENVRLVYDYVHGDVRIPVAVNALGKHNVLNSLAGMAVADYLGLDIYKSAKSFESFVGLRQKIINIPGKFVIIDDTYNASPDSMKASLDVLSDIEVSGKKFAVLGDMFELGENSKQFHYDVGVYAAEKGIFELATVGELSVHIANGVNSQNSKTKCYSFKDNGEASLFLLSAMNPGDVVLIKGSHGMHMEEIVQTICG